jgi:preprotein translocase subunit SecE
MRINPDEKIIKKDKIAEALKLKTDKITRIVALVVAFISVFFFIIKIMFL